MLLAAFDYSMTSPAMAYLTSNDFDIHNVGVYVCPTMKVKEESEYLGVKQQPDGEGIIRFRRLANLFTNEVRFMKAGNNNEAYTAIEGYSFGSRVGMAFHIGENVGTLKNALMDDMIPYVEYPPTQVKAFATGKGNADKETMLKCFNNAFNIDARDHYKVKNAVIYDIVDSVWILYILYHHVHYLKTKEITEPALVQHGKNQTPLSEKKFIVPC